MGIGVQGDSHLGMPKALAHDLRMDAVAQELGRVGVTEIVKPDTGQIRSADKTGKCRGETVGRPRAAIRARADNLEIFKIFFQLCDQPQAIKREAVFGPTPRAPEKLRESWEKGTLLLVLTWVQAVPYSWPGGPLYHGQPTPLDEARQDRV